MHMSRKWRNGYVPVSGLPLPHSDISLKGKYDKDDGLWEDIGHGER